MEAGGRMWGLLVVLVMAGGYATTAQTLPHHGVKHVTTAQMHHHPDEVQQHAMTALIRHLHVEVQQHAMSATTHRPLNGKQVLVTARMRHLPAAQ